MSAKLSQHRVIRSRDLVAGPLVVQLLEDAFEVQYSSPWHILVQLGTFWYNLVVGKTWYNLVVDKTLVVQPLHWKNLLRCTPEHHLSVIVHIMSHPYSLIL